MHALLLIAHGSRRAASNDEVRELAARLQELAWERFERVIPAFLELAEPDIPTGVDLCRKAGATSITALPYFLSAGRHVARDIPEELGKAALEHPDLRIHLTDHLGRHEAMPSLILQAAFTGNGATIPEVGEPAPSAET